MTKILLVEDDKSLREIYGVRLLAEGYDIVSAGDGEEALAMAIKDRPALIVSDVMMPKISGFDMLDILRSTTETRDIKVIMMTALSSEDQRKRGESLGADRYLVKSQVGIEDVVRAVHEVLGDAPGATPSPQPSPIPAPVTPSPAPVASTQPSFRSGPQGAPGIAVPARDGSSATPAADSSPTIPAAPTIPSTPVAPEPVAPAATPAPEPVSLPQPTAPFSTQRPASLGDRIIQPISNPSEDADDVADRMAKELSALGGSTSASTATSSSSAPPAPEPVAPAAAPTPTPEPVAAAPSTPTTPPVVGPVAPPASAAVTTPPQTSDSGTPQPPHLDFEETPRQAPPASPPAAL